MKLTTREKSALIMEAFVTIVILLLVNLSVIVILNDMIQTNPGLQDGIFIIKRSMVIGPNHYQLWSWENIFIGLMIAADAGVVYWRLIRRYHQMQLRHIIDELHYIANGHFDHRIPFTLKGDTQRVVTSVNALVDSVISSIEDERRIEKSKDELITNVSHDLRTPLTSIIGYLGLIEDHQYHSEDDILKYTHTAFSKAKQMKSLVEDLFEYTKMRQTDTPMNISKIDINQMLEQLAASFELEAEDKGIKVSVDIDDKPLQIEADAEKLGRVFNNLITNALKYGDGGHNIILRSKPVSEREIQVSVENDGSPIPEASLKQVFERFYRVEGSRSKATGGTGLGLAIAQSIVDRHGGYIYVTSDNEMTRFIIHLPVKNGEKIEHVQPKISPEENREE
ncbi:sensor histidine kinase [Secundilactobacillus collinoides]|uniref:histidine kinase n=2 Tax=Secundilactobacillus collinoides TaxID=33960 RepID=A0A0R2BBX7_SECCO|nr:HAMP domain-containing sensor histidine kinase [Secundilactobacillus collinoides]KRM76861.1 ATPase histidine kinase DNA gyrase B HSP90 domain protein [Secundilactobacillus collinoides DSM 20515 = JCM 1123]KZL36701.1 histidine kinase [Secundilactobacillus collinoides]